MLFVVGEKMDFSNLEVEFELLQVFYVIFSIDKVWMILFRKGEGGFDVVVVMSQVNFLVNVKWIFLFMVYILEMIIVIVIDYYWLLFLFEISGVSLIVFFLLGVKVLIICNFKDVMLFIKFEIWGFG